MDKIQKPSDFPFISELINIKDFIAQGSETYKMAEDVFGLKNNLTFLQQFDQPNINAESLKTSFEGFNLDDLPYTDLIPDEISLVSTDYRRREIEERKKRLSYRQTAHNILKYRRTDFGMIPCEDLYGANENGGDALLRVLILRPYNQPLEYHKIRLGRLMSLDSAFVVRADNTLDQLQKHIACVSDQTIEQDVSEMPFREQEKGNAAILIPPNKERFKGCFFYIEGTFYNLDGNGYTDLCSPIIKWSRTRQEEIGPFSSDDMKITKFSDLSIRLGQSYLYRHQGSCDHLIVFTDIRMLACDDCQSKALYPMAISPKLLNRTPCSACKVFTANFVMFGNDRLPIDPSFWCSDCYAKFNYDQHKVNKIGNFRSYLYTDRSVI